MCTPRRGVFLRLKDALALPPACAEQARASSLSYLLGAGERHILPSFFNLLKHLQAQARMNDMCFPPQTRRLPSVGLCRRSSHSVGSCLVAAFAHAPQLSRLLSHCKGWMRLLSVGHQECWLACGHCRTCTVELMSIMHVREVEAACAVGGGLLA